MESTLIKKIKRSKKIFLVLIAVIIFYAAFYYVFFVPKTFELEDTGTAEVQDTSYQEYRDYVSNTNKGIKNLLDGEQLKQINVFQYPLIDLNIPRNENPFAKSF